jgi:hypothetical protein
MEWTLSETRKTEYQQALSQAKELEANIGASTYRLYKFNKMREEIENLLKKLRFNGYVRNEMRTPKNRKGRLSVVFPLFNVRKFMETYFTSNATNEIASSHSPSEISFDSLGL